MRLGLVEASAGKIGGFSDQILLYCYMYDPARGRYSAAVLNLVRAGALLTIVSLVTFIGVSRRRDDGSNRPIQVTLPQARRSGMNLPLFPESASTVAGEVDLLYLVGRGDLGLLLAADRRCW